MQFSNSTDQWCEQGHMFSHKGQTLFYKDEGVSSSVLLLHGYPTSSWDFHKIWPGLTSSYRVVAPDLLGYGFSSKPKAYPYTVADHADMVEALLARAGLSRVKLVAHDIGVNVAQELVSRAHRQTSNLEPESVLFMNGTLFDAERRPRLIQRLLGSPVGGSVNALASQRTFVRTLMAITGTAKTDLATEFAAHWALLNHPGSARITHKLLHTVRDRRENERRWADDLCASSVPLRFVIGPDDPTSGLGMPESLGAYCAKVFSTVTIFGAGHFPHLEAPEQTLQAILEWYESGYQ